MRLAIISLLMGGLIACGMESDQAPQRSTKAISTPAYPSLTHLQRALDAGRITSSQLVADLVERAEQRASLNAFITLNPEAAARAAELDRLRAAGQIVGPLHGLPLVVKDNIHVAGLPNTAGTPALAEFVPAADNGVVAALKDAGAIILGKTNMHELAFGVTSDNHAHGAVGNPWDSTLFAGGSSGGTAAAIAAGLAPAGLGSDTGGSVRIPAALTGIAGYRPSPGRYDTSAVTPISTTRDTVGSMARSVTDLVLLDQAITGEVTDLPPVDATSIRLGIARDYYYANLEADLAAQLIAALSKLEQAGITIVDVSVENLPELIGATGFPIAVFEFVRDMTSYLDAFETGVDLSGLTAVVASPDVKALLDMAVGDTAVSADAYAAAMQSRETLRDNFRRMFEDNQLDALVFPTTPMTARPIEGSIETVQLNGQAVPTFPTYIRNTDPASIAALPAISLPAGVTTSGLPFGLEIDGPEGSDRRLLAVALHMEQLLEFSATPTSR